MINDVKFHEALADYKRDFVKKQWPQEKYKWEAVKCFQDNWDEGVPDFADMLKRSLAKTYNLLASKNNFPALMIMAFAKKEPETLRTMFHNLYDETKDVVERIKAFKGEANALKRKYLDEKKSSYQKENPISAYLWLRYPDKYYIYKFEEVKRAAAKLGSDARFKDGEYGNNLRNFYAFYDELCAKLKEDHELRDMLASQLTDSCYKDQELKTLTTDFSFYVSRYCGESDETSASEEWWPSEDEYVPGLSMEDWRGLLSDHDVFTDDSLKVMERMLGNGGQATCTELANKYGDEKNFYISVSANLAKRVYEKTDCPLPLKSGNERKWWPILYVGKSASGDEEGSFIWRLRPELKEALKRMNLFNANCEPYSKDDFLRDVYMSGEKYDRLRFALERKKNVILQGAPGIGKTFAAKRLAYSIMGVKDESRVGFVQFHQNYSYEDFVMGYKPNEDGSFRLKNGIFYDFCKRAEKDRNRSYFFIIDEINRGNMSKIFGELLMLIENDYRGEKGKVILAYRNESFSVPSNLYIIGMMNTADRSLAMIDYALRRRFSFIEMEPAFDSDGFKKYQKGLENKAFDSLIEKVNELNKTITEDKSLGKGFCIGHSYFCGIESKEDCTSKWMEDVVDFDIIPMLSEYWFDDAGKADKWAKELHDALAIK